MNICVGTKSCILTMPPKQYLQQNLYVKFLISYIIASYNPYCRRCLKCFACSKSLFTESPRWLASEGKIARCMESLQHIAKISKQQMPESAEENLQKIAEQSKGKVYGPTSFLSSKRLAANTALVIVCW